MKRIALILIILTLVSTALSAAQRRVSSKPAFKSLIYKLNETAQYDGFYMAFLKSQSSKLFKKKMVDEMIEDQKCTKNSDYTRANQFLVYFSDELIGVGEITKESPAVSEFRELLGDEGYLYCVDYESDYMVLSEYHYFIANDKKFKIRFEVGMED